MEWLAQLKNYIYPLIVDAINKGYIIENTQPYQLSPIVLQDISAYAYNRNKRFSNIFHKPPNIEEKLLASFVVNIMHATEQIEQECNQLSEKVFIPMVNLLKVYKIKLEHYSKSIKEVKLPINNTPPLAYAEKLTNEFNKEKQSILADDFELSEQIIIEKLKCIKTSLKNCFAIASIIKPEDLSHLIHINSQLNAKPLADLAKNILKAYPQIAAVISQVDELYNETLKHLKLTTSTNPVIRNTDKTSVKSLSSYSATLPKLQY